MLIYDCIVVIILILCHDYKQQLKEWLEKDLESCKITDVCPLNSGLNGIKTSISSTVKIKASKCWVVVDSSYNSVCQE